MSPELAVAAGAALGAPARYLLDAAVTTRSRWSPPAGIVLVNLLGCLGAGIAVGAGAGSRFLAVGFLGAFTTASTVAWDVLRRGGRRSGAGLLALHVVPGLLLAGLGLAVGRAL